MLIRNGCPRCKGHVYIECDDYGYYKACMTCGYMHDLENVAFIQRCGTKHSCESPLQEYDEIAPPPLELE